MSQQSLNTQQVVQIVRRHKILVCTLAVVGALAGAAISVLNPPLVSSQAVVVLPQDVPGMPNSATEAVIASSEPVLSRALPRISPPMPMLTLDKQVSAQAVTSSVISITAKGKSAAQAESAANAVANSYIAYADSPAAPVVRMQVQLLESATTATGMKAPAQDALDAGLGLLAGLVAGILVALVIGRRGRRLSDLDDIANSIGVPVLAAVPVGHPIDATGWTRLLDGYQPGSVEAWRLRQALQEITTAAASASSPGPSSVTVLSMPTDPRSMALGPQLAAFGASLGLATLLVAGPQQDTSATAALYTACGAPHALPKRSGYLRTVAADTVNVTVPAAAQLVVVVAVAEGKTPQIPRTMPTAVTVLGVTAGVATPDRLARLAIAAAADGREVAGLLVADPDPADRTTGRFPRPARRVRRVLGPELPGRLPDAPSPGSGPASQPPVASGPVIEPEPGPVIVHEPPVEPDREPVSGFAPDPGLAAGPVSEAEPDPEIGDVLLRQPVFGLEVAHENGSAAETDIPSGSAAGNGLPTERIY